MKKKLMNYFFSSLYSMSSRPHSVTDLLKIHGFNKPSLFKGAFTENAFRHQQFFDTLRFLELPHNVQTIQKQASINMQAWKDKAEHSPNQVEVIGEDWGQVTLDYSKRYGKTYAVLNMASAEFPGGGCFEGGNAQEENMWQRSDCVLSLLEPGIIFNKEDLNIHYIQDFKQLIEAKKLMTESEYQQLQAHCPDINPAQAFKVYFEARPRVCFKGPELYLPESSDNSIGCRESLDIDNSLRTLQDFNIFPFFEMRSAAPAPSDTQTPQAELQRRIAAQLDTLIIHEKKHAVLGAWGCGQYKHHPEMISELYAQELEKRSGAFEHIVFAIRTQGHRPSHNLKAFIKNLEGIQLDTPKTHKPPRV